MIFDKNTATDFTASYPGAPARLRHTLIDHPLLSMERLTNLTAALRAGSAEYNAGDLPVDQDPEQTPMNGLSAEETVRRIAECNSWIVLKNIEQDQAFSDLLEGCLEEVAEIATVDTGPMYKKEGFIFISSPNAVTPFHMDPEHNILLQIRGRKTMRVYPARHADLVSAEQHEAFHTDGGHRNLSYQDTFESHATAFDMGPGDATYVPVKAPHWVKVGNEVSVSLSITWRSRISDNDARLHKSNAWLRRHGASPPMAGEAPLRDQAKILAHRLASRLSRH